MLSTNLQKEYIIKIEPTTWQQVLESFYRKDLKERNTNSDISSNSLKRLKKKKREQGLAAPRIRMQFVSQLLMYLYIRSNTILWSWFEKLRKWTKKKGKYDENVAAYSFNFFFFSNEPQGLHFQFPYALILLHKPLFEHLHATGLSISGLENACFKFPNHFSNHQGKAEDGLTFWNKSWGNINRTHIVSHYSNWQRSSSKSKIKLLHLFLLNKKQNIISKQMTSGYEQKINNT